LKKIMNPLTGLYGLATAAHNALFDHGVLRAKRLRRPVISVGNLSTGGSGKTPFVIALGGWLKERDIRFDVLSRGYRRKTRGVLVVDPEGRPSDFGDEPLLLTRQLNVPVIVGESRYQAGLAAERQFQSQLHIVDDGFQHRSLHRDFDIVILLPDDESDRLLPAGRLREPMSSLRRADALVLPPGVSLNNHGLREKPVWRMHREILLPELPRFPIVFCGIARPGQFFAQIRAAGITPAAEVAYRDHHAYAPSDIQKLSAMRSDRGAGGFVTTEKDAVNLGPLQADLAPFAVARLRIHLDRAPDVVETILARIAERSRAREKIVCA
jgi:tetraacyldisaccharide 4'-kinase